MSLRPYQDEALSSWLSRAGAVYGCSTHDLLSDLLGKNDKDLDFIDLHLPPELASSLQVLLGANREEVHACTLRCAHPLWINDWVGCAPPLWNTTDRRTVLTGGPVSAICSACLAQDSQIGRSQFVRLAWYCSAMTVCPTHRTPLTSCCRSPIWHSVFRADQDTPVSRAYCPQCQLSLDRLVSWDCKVDPQAITALVEFESLLRDSLSKTTFDGFTGRSRASGKLLDMVQDMSWALMRPVAGTPHRALHFLATLQFPVPFGFNTPVHVEDWLSRGSLLLRRSILAVIARLFLPAPACSTLLSQAGRGIPFWTELRSLHSGEDRSGLDRKSRRWSSEHCDALEFY